MRFVALIGALLASSCAHRAAESYDDPRCLAARGCPTAKALPICSEADAARSEGVTIEGRLVEGEVKCSAVRCPRHCCNECAGRLAVFDGTRNVELVGRGLELVGDDSKICFATGRRDQKIVARGKLRELPGHRVELDVGSICARDAVTVR